MSNERVEIVYDGDALREGTMDVHDLAPALIGVGDLCRAANRVVNGDLAEVTVLVRANRLGSFGVEIEVVQKILDAAQTLFGTASVASAADLLRLIGFAAQIADTPSGSVIPTVKNLFELLKWLKGRSPSGMHVDVAPGGLAIIVDGNSNSVVVDKRLIRLADDPEARRSALRVVKPLKKPGIDRFEARHDHQTVETVTRDEVPLLEGEAQGGASDSIDDQTSGASPPAPQLLEVVKPWLKCAKNKWTFSDGTVRFPATVADDRFLSRVERGEVGFRAGQVLEARMQRAPKITPKGRLKTEYTITEVTRDPFTPPGAPSLFDSTPPDAPNGRREIRLPGRRIRF